LSSLHSYCPHPPLHSFPTRRSSDLTMAFSAAPRAGAFYRLDPDYRVTRMFDGVTISNGLDWTDDNRTMYYIDSPTQQVDAFEMVDRKSTRLNSSHVKISYAVFCLKK